MINLRFCWITPKPFGVETSFIDGTCSANWPPDDPDFPKLARDCGFIDPLSYIRDHDLSHAFMAERMFNVPSPVLWNAAHGIEKHGEEMAGCFEERIIYHWQRFASGIYAFAEPEWFAWRTEYLPLREAITA